MHRTESPTVRRRIAPFAAATILTLAALACATPAPAAAATSCRTLTDNFPVVVGDIDADGIGDSAVGLPASNAVDIQLGDGGRQRLTPDKLDLATGLSASFGDAVTLVDLDEDHCSDLVVGSSAESAIYLARGSTLGIGSAGALRVPTPGATGDRFGAALAVSRGETGADLWVGAPYATISGRSEAGVVYHYRVDLEGKPTLAGSISYADLPGAVEAGDRFGQVLSAGIDGVHVGVPRRTVSGKSQAGEVAYVHQSAGGATTTQIISQNTPGVPGTAEAGDHFGAAVDTNLVGVPGEDIGSVSDAGTVDLITSSATGQVTAQAFQQGARGLPGKVEAGDQFGAAVAHQAGAPCQFGSALVFGSPGEDLGSVRDAGSVVVFSPDNGEAASCPARSLTQGAGLPGARQAGARVGAALSTIAGEIDEDEDTRATLNIGAPGVDGGRGAVFHYALRSAVTTDVAIGSRLARDHFGTVLGVDAGGIG